MPNPSSDFILGSGEKVQDRCQFGRNNRESPISNKMVEEALLQVEGGPMHLKVTVNLAHLLPPGGALGLLEVVSRPKKGWSILARRAGKPWRSPFVLAKNPPSTTLLTVVLEWEKDSQIYSLIGCRPGPSKPPEPQDNRSLEREIARRMEETGEPKNIAGPRVRQSSVDFWRRHAWRLGSQTILCGRCSKRKVSRDDTLAGLDLEGKRILCPDCDAKVGM